MSYEPKNYKEPGGNRTVIGGSLDVVSGGEMDIESGGALKIGGTAVSASAAELNLLDGVSGLVQADLTKLAAIDASAAEINLLGGVSGLVQADLTKLAALDASAAQINKLQADGLVVVDEIDVDASGGGSAQGTNLTLLPAGAVLLGVIAVVSTAFDGDTTTTFEVGVSGNTDKYIDPVDFDPSAVAGTQLSMPGGTNNDQKYPEYMTAQAQLIATWTNTASAAAGEIKVIVIWANLA